MRQCKIASGCKLAHHPCCKDCKEKRCEARCLNSPSHCGCWTEVPEPAPAKRDKPRKSRIDRQEILRLHEKGLLQRQIAASMGCSESTVCLALKELGVTRHG